MLPNYCCLQLESILAFCLVFWCFFFFFFQPALGQRGHESQLDTCLFSTMQVTKKEGKNSNFFQVLTDCP